MVCVVFIEMVICCRLMGIVVVLLVVVSFEVVMNWFVSSCLFGLRVIEVICLCRVISEVVVLGVM